MMTEVEYINCTNLARVRDAMSLVRGLMAGGIVEDASIGEAAHALWKMEEKLARHVKTKETK